MDGRGQVKQGNEDNPSIAHIEKIRQFLIEEIFTAFARPIPAWLRFLLTPVIWIPANRFARLAARLDRRIADDGITAAARWFLPHFVVRLNSNFAGCIPTKGPILIASNHPGAYDVVAIASCLERDDLKIVVSDELFYRSLPALNEHLIYVAQDAQGRMASIREMIHHLNQGGVILIFPSGKVDPDPALNSDLRATELVTDWSGSIEIVLRRIPETHFIVAIASGVLSRFATRNPLTRIPPEPWQQRKSAEFIQVILQMVFGFRFGLSPRVSFQSPVRIIELEKANNPAERRDLILNLARAAVSDHMCLFLGGEA
jgi:hypothetical protein